MIIIMNVTVAHGRTGLCFHQHVFTLKNYGRRNTKQAMCTLGLHEQYKQYTTINYSGAHQLAARGPNPAREWIPNQTSNYNVRQKCDVCHFRLSVQKNSGPLTDTVGDP